MKTVAGLPADSAGSRMFELQKMSVPVEFGNVR
jgi:hypothetical protein